MKPTHDEMESVINYIDELDDDIKALSLAEFIASYRAAKPTAANKEMTK